MESAIILPMRLAGVILLTVALACDFVCGAHARSSPPQEGITQVRAPRREIRHPQFVPAAQASFLKDSDQVIGVSIQAEAKAYWAPEVAWHDFVQDHLGEMPILVTWCNLCGTGMVFRPSVDGRALRFEVTGLRGFNMVIEDQETHSQWQQATGEAFAGPLRGKRLPLVPFSLTSWGEWRARHADTLVLAPVPDNEHNYERMRVTMRAPAWDSQPPVRLLHQDPRLLSQEVIAGLTAGGAHKAYPVDLLKDTPVVNDQVGAAPVLVVYTVSTETVTAFSRRLEGHTLSFSSAQNQKLIDGETHSDWNSYGECIAGKFKGRKLVRLTPEPAFWFAWAEFHPDTEVYFPK